MSYETFSLRSKSTVIAGFVLAASVVTGSTLSQDKDPTTTPLLRASVAVDTSKTARTPSAASPAKSDDELRMMEAELLKSLEAETPKVTELPKGPAASKMKIAPVKAPVEPPIAEPLTDPFPQLPSAPEPSRKPTPTKQQSDLAATLHSLESHPALIPTRNTRPQVAKAALNPKRVEVKEPKEAKVPYDPDEEVDEEDLLHGYERPRSHTVPIEAIAPRNADGVIRQREPNIATIAVARTQLRVAPGSNETVLFSLGRTSTVDIEMRTGEWYRIITPSGQRGWVHGGALLFDPSIGPESAVRIGAVHPSFEPTGIRY